MSLKTLFALEWIKVRNLRTLIFLLVFVLIATAFSLLMLKLSGVPPEEGAYLIPLQEINVFGRLLATFTGNLAVISSLFFILQAGGEYKHGLIKKNIIDGMSRSDVFNGRLIFLFTTYTFWALLLVLVFVICGLIRVPGDFAELFKSIRLTQFIKYLIYLYFYGAFALFLVTITRSSTISILIFLGILFIEPFVVLALRYYDFTTIIPYLPFELASGIRTEDSVSDIKIIVFLGYFLSFLGLSQFVNYKRDL